ncbi:hypothetical protein [Methanopyrus kandleri]|uniref:Uncharacterized protein n=1 Tax=Methanopyrus kandleri TaxID=2320 RepID=A0A832WMV5_9EURY|nr:hypothetical protein [Methanopyrus kandleri]HII70642.1 hypothetical protein [Methanopyrus kandleri]
MGAAFVTVATLTTVLLALLTYSIGVVGRWIKAPIATTLGAAIIGAGVGLFLLAPMLSDIPKVVAGLEKNGYLTVELSTAPSDLPKALEAVKKYRGKPVGRYLELEVAMSEPVPSDRRRWFESKVPKVFPGVKDVRFSSPTKMVVRMDLKSVPPSKVSQLADELSGWITYTSGFVVVGVTATIDVEVPPSEYADLKGEIREIADLRVIYDPTKAAQRRIARMLPSPRTTVIASTLAFAGIAVIGWYGISHIIGPLTSPLRRSAEGRRLVRREKGRIRRETPGLPPRGKR